MKIVYTFLYKNGMEEKIEQEINTEEEQRAILDINEAINASFGQGVDGQVTLSSDEQAHVIRLSEVIRVKIDYVEG